MKTRGFEVIKGYNKNEIIMPVRKTKSSAGYDIATCEDIKIMPYKKGDNPYLIKTGLKAYMLEDEVLILYPRSSLFKKMHLMFPHSNGIIDSDYYENEDNDGHILIQVINLSDEEVFIKKGTFLIQGIFQKYLITDNDNANETRKGGIGSTDKKN